MTRRRAKRISKADVDMLVRTIETAIPVLTKPQLKQAESNFDSWTVTRRTAMAVLSVPGAQLVEKISRDRRTALSFARLTKSIEKYRVYLEAQRGMLETAKTRCDLALCFRTDMEDLLREADRAVQDP